MRNERISEKEKETEALQGKKKAIREGRTHKYSSKTKE